MIEIEHVIKRVKRLKCLKRQEDVATLVGIKHPDFCNRKSRGTLFKLFIEWAFHENVNLDWLFYERGQPYTKKEGEFIKKAQYVLQAGHPVYTDALKKNIIAFHMGLLADVMPLEKPASRDEEDQDEPPVEPKKKTTQQLT